MTTLAAKANRRLLADFTATGILMSQIGSGYRKHKRTPGERYRRRKRARDLQRNAWRSFFEAGKREAMNA